MTTEVPGLNPARTALLVMDYQNGVISQVAEPDELVALTASAIAAVRAAGGTVGHVRVGFTDADYEGFAPTSRMGAMAKAAGRALDADAPATQIDERVAPQAGDIVVRKTRVGAFSTTDLDKQLNQRGIDTLVLAGIATSGVTLSTVRDASDRDYRILVLEDGCADRDPEVHDVLMHKVFPRQAEVITIAQLTGLLGQGS